MSDFVHLHVHSHYSLLDGLGKIDGLIEKAIKNKQTALALTDHGVMYGIIEFAKKAKVAGIKPILGCELYIAPRSHLDKTPKIDTSPFHIVLLCKNNEGYQNLLKLASIAQLEGYYYKPRIDLELLKKYSKGLIGLTSCLQGEIPQLVKNNNLDAAIEKAKIYNEIFGQGNFYLELQHHPGIPEQKIVNEKIIEISKQTGIPLVATNDAHYINSDDADAQDILLCVQTGKTVNDKDRMSMLGDDFSLLPSEKMEQNFSDIPEALENTAKIAEMCNVEIEFGRFIFPKLQIEKGKTINQKLEEICYENLPKKYEKITDQISERLKYELSIIEKTDFANYMLVVADYTNYAKSQGILVNTRGSAAGSLVSHLLGITDIDPIKYDLLFERFLNPERISWPDVDLDIADVRRQELIDYVTKKYGQENVAQIITFGTMAARNAVRDCARAMGLPYLFADKLSKMIPPAMKLEEAIKKVPDLQNEYKNDIEAKKLLDLAKRLEGVARHASTHAAGVVIADKNLTEYVPLQLSTKSGEKLVITQYEMHALEDLGLVKMDFLGLANLSIIEKALEIIKKTKKIEIDLPKIPQDDEKTYELLSRGNTTGVFQLESSGMKRYLRELKPTQFSDIIAMVALYRPGPMELIPDYIAGKHGEKQIKYLDERLEPILEETYGVAVYQEQVLQIAQTICGFSLGQADILRKAIGKKIKELLLEQKSKWVEGAIANGTSKEIAEKLFEFVEPFARYGFNKAHATSYAQIAYQTAYLKAHYPSEFMAALLTADQDNIDRIAIEVSECQVLGIKVLPPSVNESFHNFTVLKNGDIRFGLGAIKNVGTGSIEAIVAARKAGGHFQNLEDFIRRVDFQQLNRKVLESLVKSGACDCFGERGQMMISIDLILKFAMQMQKSASAGQQDLFGNSAEERSNGGNALELPPADEVSKRQKLSWERELLGIFVSDHPLSSYQDFIKNYSTPITQLNGDHDGKQARVSGIITKIHKILTRNGEQMIFATIEDMQKSMEAVVFPKKYADNSEIWHEDNVVMVEGKINNKDGALKILVDKVEEIGEQMTMIGQPLKAHNDNAFWRKKVEKPKKVIQNEIKKLYLSIPNQGSKEILSAIKEIILKYPGDHPVVLKLFTNGNSQMVETKTKVRLAKAMMNQLRELLGKSKVFIKSY